MKNKLSNKYDDYNLYVCSHCGKVKINEFSGKYYRRYENCSCSNKNSIMHFLLSDSIDIEHISLGVIDSIKSDIKSISDFKIVKHHINRAINIAEIRTYFNDNEDKNINEVIKQHNLIKHKYITREIKATYTIVFNLIAKAKKDKVVFYINGERQKGWKRNINDHFSFTNSENMFKRAMKPHQKEKIETYYPGAHLKDMIEYLMQYPHMEILLKAGYHYEKNNYSNSGYIDPIPYLTNKDGKTPTEILKLNKAKAKFYRACTRKEVKTFGYNYYSNNLSDLLNILQDEAISIDKFKKCLEFTSDYFERSSESNAIQVGYCNPIFVSRIFKFANTHGYDSVRLVQYLSEEVREHQGIYNFNNAFDTLRDYVETSTTLEMPFEKYPRTLALNHDRITYLKLLKADDYAKKKFEEARDFNSKLDYSNSKYSMISPKDISDLKREGAELHHCVGTYVDKYASMRSRIFFMRNNENKNRALVTVELSENYSIVQVKGANNRAATPEEMKFVNEFAENISMALSKGVA